MRIILGLVAGAGAVMVVGWLILGRMNEATPTSTPIPEKVYTLSEVSTHNSAESCWLIINNNVYDVTAFAKMHPGGEDKILFNCGKDATKAFETQGGKGEHSDAAKKRLAGLLIGKIE